MFQWKYVTDPAEERDLHLHYKGVVKKEKKKKVATAVNYKNIFQSLLTLSK